MPTVYEEIAAAKELLDQGILTQGEFDAKKAQLLARSEQREATQEAAAKAAASPPRARSPRGCSPSSWALSASTSSTWATPRPASSCCW